MSDATEAAEVETKKTSKIPLVIACIGALGAGGGSYYAVSSGMIFGGESHEKAEVYEEDTHTGEIAFLPIEPLMISFSSGEKTHQLRFRGQLEIPASKHAKVEKMLPRVVDVLNTYMRALDLSDLQSTSALVVLRAQMLRRVKLVLGPENVNDLLVMEFILS